MPSHPGSSSPARAQRPHTRPCASRPQSRPPSRPLPLLSPHSASPPQLVPAKPLPPPPAPSAGLAPTVPHPVAGGGVEPPQRWCHSPASRAQLLALLAPLAPPCDSPTPVPTRLFPPNSVPTPLEALPGSRAPPSVASVHERAEEKKTTGEGVSGRLLALPPLPYSPFLCRALAGCRDTPEKRTRRCRTVGGSTMAPPSGGVRGRKTPREQDVTRHYCGNRTDTTQVLENARKISRVQPPALAMAALTLGHPPSHKKATQGVFVEPRIDEIRAGTGGLIFYAPVAAPLNNPNKRPLPGHPISSSHLPTHPASQLLATGRGAEPRATRSPCPRERSPPGRETMPQLRRPRGPTHCASFGPRR